MVSPWHDGPAGSSAAPPGGRSGRASVSGATEPTTKPDPPASGSSEELADLLRGYAREGITHVQVWLDPSTVAGVEAFAPVLDLLDRG